MPSTEYAFGMDKFKVIDGSRHEIEKALMESIFRGERDLELAGELKPKDSSSQSSADDGKSLEQAFKHAAARLKANTEADPLERNTLLAIIEDRDGEANRLLEVMRKRNARGLTVVKGGKATPPQSS